LNLTAVMAGNPATRSTLEPFRNILLCFEKQQYADCKERKDVNTQVSLLGKSGTTVQLIEPVVRE
jgi:hypothetical protein